MSSGPVTKRATELPVQSFSDWDFVPQVKAAIRSLENGIFFDSALIVDAMGRDDRVSGCLMMRAEALPCLPMNAQAKGKGRKGTKLVTELEEKFEEFFPDAELADLVKWGTMLGLGVGEIIWTTGEKRWEPRLKVWHPRYLHYRWDTRRFYMMTQEGTREVNPGDGQWVIYSPGGLNYAWTRGKLRSLYIPWLVRQWAWRDWARYGEVHGLPFKKAKIPLSASQADREAFIRDLASLGSETTIATPQGMTGQPGDNYDVELVEALGNSWQTFESVITKSDIAIAVSLLGQNLTTEVSGGSYAAATVHQNLRADVLQGDADKLGQCLRSQVLRHWARYNFGDEELAPLPTWNTRPPEDKKVAAETLSIVGDSVTKLRGAGFSLDSKKLIERFDIPATEEIAELAATEAAAEEDEAVVPEEKLAQLSAANQDVPKALIEGQAYVDEVVQSATIAAREALAPDLLALLSIVEKAEDEDDLKKRLVELYREMDPSKLARLTHHSMMMARLSGRYSVKREIKES